MTIQEWLDLDLYYADNFEIAQNELRKIKYIKKHTNYFQSRIEFELLEAVLNRLHDNDLSISFIMSNNNGYELVLIGSGKWKDSTGKVNYIGKGKAISIYDCVVKAVICLYKFLQMHKLE